MMTKQPEPVAVASAQTVTERFRHAMSRVAAAVHVITTDGPAGRGGLTVSAVTSVTLDPPTMLFCMNKSASSVSRFIENGVFCINTLAPADVPLSNVFAGRTDHQLEERFVTGEWEVLATGAPVLRTAVAAFDCRIVEAKEVGTHLVVIGTVEGVEYGEEGESLAYLHRKYRTI